MLLTPSSWPISEKSVNKVPVQRQMKKKTVIVLGDFQVWMSATEYEAEW